MTKLVVDELRTTLEQVINITQHKRITVAGLRPYIYMHNSPAGTFTIKLKDGATVLGSKDFTSSEIKSDMATSDNYIHLWKRIIFDDTVHLRAKTYTIELSSSGYTYSDSSYLAMIREHENETNVFTPSFSDLYNPISTQLFELKEAK